MIKIQRQVSLAVLLTGSLVFATGVNAQASIKFPARALSAQEEKTRAEFGLTTNPRIISTSLSNINSQSVEQNLDVLGIPLTNAEAANIRSRDSLGSTGAAITNKVLNLTKNADSVGNPWIDQAAGGVLHIQVTSPSLTVKTSQVATELAPSARVVVDTVSHSRSELQQIASDVQNLMISKQGIGQYIISAKTSDTTNSFDVMITPKTPPNLIRSMENKWGSTGLKIIKSENSWTPQARNRQSGPLYGGEYITNRLSQCTNGFGGAMLRSNGSRVTITAGHCGNDDTWTQGLAGRPIGATKTTGFTLREYGNCDCQAIGTIPSDSVTTKVLTSDTKTYEYLLLANTSNYSTGSRACLSGAPYGDANQGRIVCGTITGQGPVKYKDDVFTLLDAVQTNIVGTRAGDSGGPYGQSRTFLGIHAAGFGPEGGLGISTAFSKATNLSGIGADLPLLQMSE